VTPTTSERILELREIVRNAPEATSEAARRVMVANRRRDSRPELELRRAVHRCGLRFRVDLAIHVPDRRPIRPDIVFTRRRVAVFVDGCFWHGCVAHGTQPRSNSTYWAAKIEVNQARDRDQAAALERQGWAVLRVWEHEPTPAAVSRIAEAVSQAATWSGGRASAGINAAATA